MPHPSTPSPDAGITCLLADDNEVVLGALEHLLVGAGIEITGVARTGVEAVALLERQPATVIVLDVRLPGLHGFDVLRLAAENGSEAAVIFYTSVADATLVRDALELNARGVVVKGASPVNLLHAIAAVAGKTYIDPQLR